MTTFNLATLQRLLALPVLLVLFAFTLAACADRTEPEEAMDEAQEEMDDMANDMTDAAMGGDIVTVATSDGRFNTLVTAIQAAGLAETLQGDGPFTVFAPTDDAFAALPVGTLDNLLQPENREQLASILLYHVAAGEIMAADVTSMGSVTTEGGTVEITSSNGGVVLNGNANVTATDVDASNGVIHVIDAVLMPPADS